MEQMKFFIQLIRPDDIEVFKLEEKNAVYGFGANRTFWSIVLFLAWKSLIKSTKPENYNTNDQWRTSEIIQISRVRLLHYTSFNSIQANYFTWLKKKVKTSFILGKTDEQ